MKISIFSRWLSLLFVAWALSITPVSALVFDVTMDTSALINHTAAPFYLDFQLTDGSGTGNGNNSVVISNFSFGGGNPVGSADLFGGASGDLQSSVVLTDTAFFNELFQEFLPGNSLSFVVDVTTNGELPTPDQFSFAVLDNQLFEIPTESFFDVFLEMDIESSTPSVQTYASDPHVPPFGGGAAISIPAPEVTAAVPEPSVLWLFAAGFWGLLGLLPRAKVNRG